MKTSNTLTLSRFVTGALLVTGTSLVLGASGSTLQAAVVLGDDGHVRFEEQFAKRTQTLQLHQAAAPYSIQEQLSSQVLLTGMLLVLAAFVTYATFVVKTQQRTRWQRIVRWFHRHLDVQVAMRHHA